MRLTASVVSQHRHHGCAGNMGRCVSPASMPLRTAAVSSFAHEGLAARDGPPYTRRMPCSHPSIRTCCVVKRTTTVALVEPSEAGKRMASRIFTADSCGMTVAGITNCRLQSAPLQEQSDILSPEWAHVSTHISALAGGGSKPRSPWSTVKQEAREYSQTCCTALQ